MKKIIKSFAIVISLALTVTSLPWPAFAAMNMRVPVGQKVAPGGITALPVSAVNASLGGAGSLQGPTVRLNLKGSLAPLRSPMTAGAALGASPISIAGEAHGAAAAPVGAVALTAQPAAMAAVPAAAKAESSALAAEAALETAAAPQRRSLLGRMASAISAKLNFGRIFDNSQTGASHGALGFLPQQQKKVLQGVALDDAPVAPDPKKVSGVFIENYDIPGTLNTGDDIFSAGAAVLSADPASEADVERALRALVDGDPAKYGVPSSDLATVHVRRVAGVGHQADTIFAYFRQQKGGFEMSGSFLSFTVKVLQGQPVVMASMAKLYPNPPANTTPSFPDDELKEKALERLGPLAQTAGFDLEFIEKRIIFANGAWHAANLYMDLDRQVEVAVDVATGEALAWDPRAYETGAEAQPASGRILGHTTTKGPTKTNSPMADRPLPDVNVTLGDGRVVVTDSDGRFTTESGLDALVAQFKAVLTGKWAQVTNKAGGNLSVSGTLENGKEVTVTFNPAGMTEEAIAQVNGYLLTTLVHDWAKTHGLNDKRLDRSIPVNANIDDECNAYYTPRRPSLNFFKSSSNCVNTSYDTVVMHEYGHFIDDMLGGIINGGLSEGWGDIFSMFILNNPIIGEGFLKKPRNGVDYIRTGENTYQYKSYDEVHAQGQAWGGFAWKLRKSLMADLGEAAGAALAEALVVPTLLAKAANIPAAMAQVLLSDMDSNGSMPHEAQIRAAAQAHGVTLPTKPGKISGEEKSSEAPKTLQRTNVAAQGKGLRSKAARWAKTIFVGSIEGALGVYAGLHVGIVAGILGMLALIPVMARAGFLLGGIIGEKLMGTSGEKTMGAALIGAVVAIALGGALGGFVGAHVASIGAGIALGGTAFLSHLVWQFVFGNS
ncbi:MAG TPA: hypothetical protein DEB40_02735 [Elusimicrobia bacterium]|nr:hypothetical protein [Elusimicrobiota bacterium]HBT60646.1 hypothetical protein [Elusimicrobiota bacterium]